MNSSSFISVQGIHRRFPLGDTEVHAVVDVSLEVSRPGITALMGPSGSGKSTLLNAIGALDDITSGKIIVNDTDLGSLNNTARARFRNATCGFIFQNFNLIPVLTTLENVLLPGQLSRHRSKQIQTEKAIELLGLVGLKDQIHQSVNRLSGGQQQRVAIARALINDPPIILADEPTANLDHATSASIMTLLQRVSTEQSKIIIMATHDHSVLPHCHRIVGMRDGRIVSDEINHSLERSDTAKSDAAS